MKKFKIFYVLIIGMLFLNFNINVFAASGKADDGSNDQELADLKSGYNSTPSLSVTEQGFVKVYGKSECVASTKKCTYNYQGLKQGESVENILKNVKCANGEKNIVYTNQGSGGIAYGLNPSSLGTYSGTTELTKDTTFYWSEDYFVKCTNDSSASSSSQTVIEIGSGNSSTSTTTTSPVQTTTQPYNSSTTVENSSTGIETYYIVLIIVSLISYSLMLIIKKYNKFKMN